MNKKNSVKLYVKVKSIKSSLVVAGKKIKAGLIPPDEFDGLDHIAEFTKVKFSFDNEHWFDYLLEALLGIRLHQPTQAEIDFLKSLMNKVMQQASAKEKVIEFDFPRNFLKVAKSFAKCPVREELQQVRERGDG